MTDDGLQIDIDLSGLNDVIADLEVFPQEIGREMTTAMELSLQLLEGQIAARTPVNTGTLRSSISHEIRSHFPNLVGAVGTPKEYAPVMEHGRRPGSRMPPVDAIRLWVVRKLGVSRDEADSVAWAVAKHIAKHGIEGRHMFEEGYQASEPHIRQLFNNAIGRVVTRFNRS